jgi:hypothetical protein
MAGARILDAQGTLADAAAVRPACGPKAGDRSRVRREAREGAAPRSVMSDARHGPASAAPDDRREAHPGARTGGTWGSA